LQIPRIAMSSAKPLDVVILQKALGDSVESPRDPYQEFGEKAASSGDWSCYILAKEGGVSTISAVLRPGAQASPPSYSQFDARTLRTSSSQFGSLLMPATSNNIFSIRRVIKETR